MLPTLFDERIKWNGAALDTPGLTLSVHTEGVERTHVSSRRSLTIQPSVGVGHVVAPSWAQSQLVIVA